MQSEKLRHRASSTSNYHFNSNSMEHSASNEPENHHDQDADDVATFSNLSNSHNHRRHPKKTQDIGNVDEERGNYEMTSLIRESSTPKSTHKIKHKSNALHVYAGHAESEKADADDTKNKSTNDARSRTLFLKTSFWITTWYCTSLATLFLNKIILSRRESASVHVLGMCQMVAAAILGGWGALGGAARINKMIMSALSSLPESVQSKLGIEEMKRETEPGAKSEHKGVPSKNDANSSSMSFHFVRDMSIVGVLRGLTVVLGLVALEHVPVSFVETIKATAPAFTVVFAWLILKERTATPVMLTLMPVIAGLILCSASELRFDAVGFTAAVMNNCADCVQNVMSKRLLARLKPTQLQFYTSVAALLLQTPFVLNDAATFLRSPASEDVAEEQPVSVEALIAADVEDSHMAGLSLTKLLIIDAVFYHLQSVSAYCVMGCMSPVSQSVANTLKRTLLVWASILYFGNPITSNGIIGIIMVVSGVFLYNHIRRIHVH